MNTLAERLRYAMEVLPPKKIKGVELARAVGVKPPSVSDWLSGKSKTMEGENLLHFFTKRCIDDLSENEMIKLSKEIRGVPTLIVRMNEGGNQRQAIYYAQEAFKYVESLIINRRQNLMMQVEQKRKFIEKEFGVF